MARRGYPHQFTPDHMRLFDQDALTLIRRLCNNLDVKIILSSSWRKLFTPEEVATGLGLPIIGRTASSSKNGHERGYEIQDWLDSHPEVTTYAIVDDDSDMLEGQVFVKTNSDVGLSATNYEELYKIFNNGSLDGKY